MLPGKFIWELAELAQACAPDQVIRRVALER